MNQTLYYLSIVFGFAGGYNLADNTKTGIILLLIGIIFLIMSQIP